MPRTPMHHLQLELTGAVQGVGFRPFVWRLAREMDLRGQVHNHGRGVTLDVQHADRDLLRRFRARLSREVPFPGQIDTLESRWLPPEDYADFAIQASPADPTRTARVLPDLATCPQCLAEVFDPGARRHRHPFANCTACGPRWSILRDLPWDRPLTTMAGFPMCVDCAAEYRDPADRRFHAQPIACPACGPVLRLLSAGGETRCTGHDALEGAAVALLTGEIVGLQGLGGFQLLVDAGQESAVVALRQRKRRPDKPLALMVRDLEMARALVALSPVEAEALGSPRGPIVLAPKIRADRGLVAPSVAPGLDELGVMLPTTPLHHLLLVRLGRALVATSGNLGDEPICIDPLEAVGRLGGIADVLLVHDRPIARPVDDAVVFAVQGQSRVLRLARGYAPLSLPLPTADPALPAADPARSTLPASPPAPDATPPASDATPPASDATPAPSRPVVLALGAHLKSAVALRLGARLVVGPHVGDLSTLAAREALVRSADDLLRLHAVRPDVIACDLHPDYASTLHASRLAAQADPPTEVIGVQHHHAHLAACLLDNGAVGPALGVTWDGTGLGTDGTLWGGEFLLGDAHGYRRVAHLRTFGLPGGEAAIAQPARVALALLWELGAGPGGAQAGAEGRAQWALDALGPAARQTLGSVKAAALLKMLERGLNAPRTSSAGRLFDGVAALLGLADAVSWEGQAAVALQMLAGQDAGEGPGEGPGEAPGEAPGEIPGEAPDEPWPMPLVAGADSDAPLVLDWAPMLRDLLARRDRGEAPARLAARFHAALAQAMVTVATRVQPLGGRKTGPQPPEVAPPQAPLRVALTGGCFQNRRLVDEAAARLRGAGFEVLLHRRLPPNDGGVAAGQAMVAAAALRDRDDARGRHGPVAPTGGA